jgi:hypothetical protein
MVALGAIVLRKEVGVAKGACANSKEVEGAFGRTCLICLSPLAAQAGPLFFALRQSKVEGSNKKRGHQGTRTEPDPSKIKAGIRAWILASCTVSR